MTGGFTSTKAMVASIVTVLTAFISLLIAAGFHIRPELRDAIITFDTVTAPVLVGAYGFLHHNHTKVVSAALLANTVTPAAPVPQPTPANAVTVPPH